MSEKKKSNARVEEESMQESGGDNASKWGSRCRKVKESVQKSGGDNVKKVKEPMQESGGVHACRMEIVKVNAKMQ